MYTVVPAPILEQTLLSSLTYLGILVVYLVFISGFHFHLFTLFFIALLLFIYSFLNLGDDIG